MGLRLANGILGSWLAFTAMLWPHLGGEFVNAVVVGLAITTFAGFGIVYERARLANALLALWLVFSTVLGPRLDVATVWNNCVVGVLVFVFALIPTRWVEPREAPDVAVSPA
jgi:hypothetical protein